MPTIVPVQLPVRHSMVSPPFTLADNEEGIPGANRGRRGRADSCRRIGAEVDGDPRGAEVEGGRSNVAGQRTAVVGPDGVGKTAVGSQAVIVAVVDAVLAAVAALEVLVLIWTLGKESRAQSLC